MAVNPEAPGAPAQRNERPAPDEWDKSARSLVRASMAKYGHSFKTLAGALEDKGYPITEKALALRVNRGTFNLGFALRMLRVMGEERLDIDHLDPLTGGPKGKKGL